METIEYKTIDKTAWGNGPWNHEPDKKQWLDPETGLSCLIVRGPMGALCGYVGVSEDHPAHRFHYDGMSLKRAARNHRQWRKQAKLSQKIGFEKAMSRKSTYHSEPKKGTGEKIHAISVHGGLTFSGHCQGTEEKGICHKTDGKDKVWWFGFDCAHYDDFCPKKDYMREGTYRDFAYVTQEVVSLAKQMAAIK